MKKTFYSQLGEDFFIYRNFINKERKDGMYIELGACDGILFSNTLFFEKELKFHGILIEPVKKFFIKLLQNRYYNLCYNCAISTQKEDIEILINGAVSGIKKHMKDTFVQSWHKHSLVKKVKTTTLSKLLKEHAIKYVDFMSLDVEGGELDVLQTIDFQATPMYLICIELDNHNETKNIECRKLLKTNGFVKKAKININEFWVNENYFRKELLFDESLKSTFSGNMDDYGNHVYMEKTHKKDIEKAIENAEKSL